MKKYILPLLLFLLSSHSSVGQQLAAGLAHSLEVCSDGTIWAWGENNSGQLGIGSFTDSDLPVQVAQLDSISSVAAADSFSLALRNDGTVWAWGSNTHGQLGDGTYNTHVYPQQVQNLSDVIKIVVGGHHSMALKSDGTVWAWGSNKFGKLGLGSSVPKYNTPTLLTNQFGIVDIAAGTQHSMILKWDGTIWSFGHNSDGQLGDSTLWATNIPIQISNINDATSIACGGYFSMCIRQDSSLWSWGDNQAGQLGIGTNGSTYDKKIPTKVDSIESVQRVVCGLLQCAAITYDSTLFTWGRNLNGQLGNGTTLINNYPKQNLISKAILDVSTGGGHTLVRTFDSTLYSFGANDIGQLGIGSPVLYSATPIIVNDPCFITTSINNTVAQVKFEIYPNPTKDLVRIASTSGKIEIYNNIGVLINEFEVGNGIKSISMNNLPSGLYVFKYSYGTFVKSQLLILL